MVKVKEDLTGRKFGRLTVKQQTEDYIMPSGKHVAQWVCDCDCGTKDVVVQGRCLKRKHKAIKSCGCLWNENKFKKQYNTYNLSKEYGVGFTFNTNKEFYFELNRYDEIKDICWIEHFSSENFSTLIGWNVETNKFIKMHILLGYEGYDHIDHNELNNLESNLRPATHQENMQNRSRAVNNTSGFIGVSWSKQRQKWIAQIATNGKTYNLGGYINIRDAVTARLRAEKEMFGAFAPQQNLYEEYGIK